MDVPASPATLAADRPGWMLVGASRAATSLADAVGPSRVTLVADPDELGSALLASRPRVLVLSRPPANAEHVALVARERRHDASMRAVLLTPVDAVADRLEALELGFDDAYDDRIASTELGARLRLLAERGAAEKVHRAILPVAPGLELDLALQGLRREGGLVHLRPKEVRLLQLFVTNPERVFTREELLDRVWGNRHAGGSRTVDVHVRWLREKIEARPERPTLLITARREGYRYQPP